MELGLHCCVGFSLAVVCVLLTVVASLVAEHRLAGFSNGCMWLNTRGLQALELRLVSCSARAQLLHGRRNLSRPGIEPMSLHWQVGSVSRSHQGSPLPKVLVFTATVLP